MSAILDLKERDRYIKIIDGILAKSDLATVTRKTIRSELEISLNRDLSHQKTAIKLLIEQRFDAVSDQPEPSEAAEETNPSPTKRSADEYEEMDEDEEDMDAEGEEETPAPQPARKKQKRESSIEDQDARLAAQLQAEENSLGRVRKTRGGGAAKVTKKPKKKAAKGAKTKKKSSAKVDDSDAEPVEKPKRTTGFMKPFNLSGPLGDLCGETQLSRPQVVKKLWQHIKANDLQDPADKRQIKCDDKMFAIFKTPKVHMFSMNKMLGAQLYPIDDGEPKKEPNIEPEIETKIEPKEEEDY